MQCSGNTTGVLRFFRSGLGGMMHSPIPLLDESDGHNLDFFSNFCYTEICNKK